MFRTGMSKGTLYLDENVLDLERFLVERNFRVRRVPPGMPDDQIIQDLLTDRIFITKNPRDFLFAALDYEFGLIGVTDAAMSDPAGVASVISKVHARLSLKTRIPFSLTVGAGGRTQFRELTEMEAAEFFATQNRNRPIIDDKMGCVHED
ncbi:MAG: hypothetical protein PHI12_11915 [Dehalococcoidales bacterium]|nr:hypothetical protein [Dehalococcoidales bacterium]